MAQPPRYERKKDFASDYGSDTDHVALNAELDGAARSINATRDNLALLQRDDGALRNGIVTADSLDGGLVSDIVVAAIGDIDDKVQQATAAATDAVNASINSANSATNSQAYAEQSLASAGIAQANAQASNANKNAAAASESAAAASAASALSSKTAAEAAVASASSSEQQARQFAGEAAESRMVAVQSAASAQSAKQVAEQAAVDATASADLAQQWATKTNGPVSGGEFSAKHYAQLAAQGMGLPIFAPDSVPTSNVGPIYIMDRGPAEWNSSVNKYSVYDTQLGRDFKSLKSAAFADLIGDVGAGAVMQSGSNANGHWWRFQNGIQICLHQSLLPAGEGSIQWTFPIPFFNSNYYVDAQGIIGSTSSASSFAMAMQYQGSYPGSVIMRRTVLSDITGQWFSIGRWK